jgi:integrase/recombinase XerD
MTDAPISALRRRMIEDMTSRRLAPRTQQAYIRAVKSFTAFLGHSPDQASAEDLRRYHLHLASSGITTPRLNAAVTALRFFFGVTLGRQE